VLVGLIVGLAGLFGLGIAAMRTLAPSESGPSRGNERRMGQGPYTRTPCDKADQLVRRLREMMEELRQAAREEEWTINWPPIDRHCQAAEKAAQARDHAQTLREYAHAISYTMQELREQRRKRKSDSSIDLL
jgi:hypothetical protein